MDEFLRIFHPALSCWRWKALLIMITGILLLAGCGTADTEVIFYEGERWHCVTRLVVPMELVEMAGGEEAAERELLSQYQKEAPRVKASWDKEYEGRNVVYHFTLDGTGWETLNRIVFDGNATINREKDQVRIRYPTSWGAELVISSLTLKGDKVISSNADETTNGSAIWYHPTGTIEAVLVEKGHINWPVILPFVLAFLVAGIMILRSLRRL